MFDRFKNNNFTKDMIQYVNGFSKDNYTCDYYTEESFNFSLRNHQENAIKSFHVNICSFDKNKFELEAYLKSLKCMFHVIGLTELGQTSIEFIEQIFDNYHIFFDKSPTTKGGGRSTYSKKHFQQYYIT